MELNYLKQAEQFVVTAVEIGEKLKNFTLDVDTKRKLNMLAFMLFL